MQLLFDAIETCDVHIQRVSIRRAVVVVIVDGVRVGIVGVIGRQQVVKVGQR